LWLKALEVEQEFGSKESQLSLLERAKEETKSELFYLMLAKHQWKQMND